jgi:RNA polymerase sigma-70 factor (ECF subfamily)
MGMEVPVAESRNAAGRALPREMQDGAGGPVARRCGAGASAEAEFTAFYQARFSDLAGQLFALTGDSSEAHDLVQEAFVRAWQRWSTVSGYEDPVGWIRRVAWNLAMSRHRRMRLFRRWAQHAWVPEAMPETGPDRVVLVAALRKVSPRQRRALVLRYLADLPIAEIAAEIGAAEGTVKALLHRGRRELAQHLADFRKGGL